MQFYGYFYPDGSLAKGKVGRDVTVEETYEHAKLVGLGLLSAAKGVGDEDGDPKAAALRHLTRKWTERTGTVLCLVAKGRI